MCGEAHLPVPRLEASRRCELLIGAGSSLKQIRAVKQAVARLNRQRWQASALLFRDAWLFSAPSGTDPLDVLCVLGTPNAEPLLLTAGAWRSAAAFAESLRPILPPETLLTLDADEGYLSIDWEAPRRPLRDCNLPRSQPPQGSTPGWGRGSPAPREGGLTADARPLAVCAE